MKFGVRMMLVLMAAGLPLVLGTGRVAAAAVARKRGPYLRPNLPVHLAGHCRLARTARQPVLLLPRRNLPLALGAPAASRRCTADYRTATAPRPSQERSLRRR